MTVAVKVVVAPHPAQGRFETGPCEGFWRVGVHEWVSWDGRFRFLGYARKDI